MKKLLTLMLVCMMSTVMLAGCKGKEEEVAGEQVVEEQVEETTSQVPEKQEATKSDIKNLSADELKQKYMDFLRGDITAIATDDACEWFEAGREYSFEEICEDELDDWENGYISDIQYAFIDCGADKNPELAVNIKLSTEFSVADSYLIFKYVDGQMRCIAEYEGYCRSGVYINEYGFVEVGGSAGASVLYFEHEMIDADGNRIRLYSENIEMALGDAYIDYYLIPEDIRPDDYPSEMYGDFENGDLVTCECYYLYPGRYVEEGETINPVFTFYNDYNEYVAPRAEFAKVYEKAGFEICTTDEMEKRLDEHVKSYGLTDQIKTGDAPDWKRLIDEGIGTLQSKPTNPQEIMNVLPGKWKMADNTYSSDIDSIYLAIEENGEYKMDINYADSYTAPGCIRGHLTFTSESGYSYDANQIGFYVEESNVNEVRTGWFMGTYWMLSYVYDSKEVTMQIYGLGDSLIEKYSNQYPTFVKAYTGLGDNKYVMFNNYNEEYTYYGDDVSAKAVGLSQLSCTENEIIDQDVWYNKVGARYHGTQWSDDKYTYKLGGIEGYGTITDLSIYSKSTGELIKTYDFHDFEYAPGYDGTDFVSRSIRYATIVDDILYVNLYHRTYAETCPYNAYVMAIDLNYDTLLWKTEPLACNSENFIVYGDVIIAGYGFTAEDHYLTLINRYTGNTMSKITVKKSPEYFHLDGDTLYVRTYSYDYVFKLN